MSERIVDANKTTTPRTNARLGQIKIECGDSCCAYYVYIDGKEYVGDLVDADFASQLECENKRLRDALETIADTGGEIEREQAREALEEAK